MMMVNINSSLQVEYNLERDYDYATNTINASPSSLLPCWFLFQTVLDEYSQEISISQQNRADMI